MDVGGWLRDLGLGRYEPAFIENAIDSDVLPELTESDLKKLGIPLGDRKRLIKAIKAITAGSPGAFTTSAVGGNEQSRQAGVAGAERRHLTVMICDLVGSTALSARLDPEDMRAVMDAYHAACARIVQAYDGFLGDFRGDGILAYFGYPRAHEDDAERTVRAGLEIIAAVAELETHAAEPLAVRIGIASGVVVIGDLSREGALRKHAVVGDTPNLAARLQALAEPGTIVVAASTRRLLGDLFRLRDLGQHEVKGIAAPVAAWAVEGVSVSESRFEAVRTAGLTRLIGREDELDFLLQRQRLAWRGEGQIVLISGEPGIGKSRLGAALAERIAGEPHTHLRYQCSPYHTNSALRPFIAQLGRAAGFKADDGPEEKLDKLEAILAMDASRVQAAATLFAALLSIPFGARYAPLTLSPTQQRRRTLAALLDQFEGLARRQPILLSFEDAHWADATSLELLDLTVERVRRLPVLALFTFRPEFEPPWVGLPNVGTLTLGRLNRDDVENMVARVVGGRVLPAEVLKQIVAKTDGNPLFVEELTKTVLEAGILVEDAEGYRLEGPLPPFAIPETLQDSLMARLDRLAPVKEIGQIGAAIGRDFSYSLLRALVGRDETALKYGLAQLEQAGLVFRRVEPPEAVYSFKHALVQDAAYENLLKSRRQVLHQRIAQALEREFPETAKTEPELLALHYAAAGLADPAISYWQTAAERALQRSANVEAANHFRQALALLATLPESGQRDERELDLQTRLGATLTTVKGFAAPEVAAAYDRARILCRESQAPAQKFSVLRGLWVYDLVRAEWHAAADLAEEMLALADDQQNIGYELESHRALGMTLLWRGMIVRAREHLEEGRRLYDPEQHRIHAFRYGNDPGIACLVHEAFALWVLGYADQALATSRRAVTLARQLGHPFSLAQALIYSLFIHQCRGEPQVIKKLADEVKTLALEHGFPFWQAEAGIMAGWATAAQGRSREGIVQLRNGVTDFLATGARMDKPRWLSLLAEAYGINNQPDEGLEAVKEALRVVDETKECFFQARLCQLNGDLLLRKGLPDVEAAAQTQFREALAIARRQEAKSWELRAATSLARLWRAQSRRREAYDLLAPVYGWFTEGFDTAALKDAKVLLDELA
jgi:class 3 adenylate cyclase/predicted ATPase/ABC-type transport system involved in cytochrome c biogenesis ATPase subunit